MARIAASLTDEEFGQVGTTRLSLAELQDLVDRLGENVAGWPAEIRSPAEALIARSPRARAIIAAAQALRAAMGESPAKAPAGLADRIVAAALDASPAKKPASGEPGRKKPGQKA